MKHQLLTKETELALAERISAGDAKAAHELALAAMASFSRAIQHRRTYGVEAEDAYQETFIALVEAAAGFDPTKGRFTTYADGYVRKALEGLARQEGPVVIPEHTYRAKVAARQGREVEAGMQARVAQATSWALAGSLDAPSGREGNDGDTLGATIASIEPTPEQQVVETTYLEGLLNTLTETEHRIIAAVFELPGDTIKSTDQRVVAKALGISPARVTQLKTRALTKLQTAAAEADAALAAA